MANWVGYITDKNYDCENRFQAFGAPSPYIRRTFLINKPIKRALFKLSSLGIFQAYVNGKSVSEEVFSPGWTDYHYSITYSTYDVTEHLVQGKNALGAVLGDGWYASNLSDVGKFVFGAYPLKLWYELTLRYTDGTTEIVKPDGCEVASTGEVRASDNQNGQIIDKRYDIGNFTLPDFDDSKFEAVELFEFMRPKKAVVEPIMPHEPLKGEIIIKENNRIVIDFKQNFAGVVRAKFSGNCGDEIKFRHAEMMSGDQLFTDNLRTAKAVDTLILSGKGEEDFYPTFTYHGFRYAEITMPESVNLISFEGVPFYSDLQITGGFECSNNIVDKFYKNVVWGQKSNFMSIPTDCPQRDERLGWTGDAQLFMDVACYNMNCANFFLKYMRDMNDSLLDGKGTVPVVLPYLFDYVPYDKLHIGYTGWSECCILMPYKHYLMYGERSILSETLPAMKQHIEYMLSVCDNYIPVGCLAHGDWLNYNDVTDKTVFSTMYFAYSVFILSRVCRILGDSDEWLYMDLFMRIKKAFRENFVYEDNKIKSDTQCCYILALISGLMNENEVKDNLERKFRERDYHLVTGFHGTKFALEALCRVGLIDIAYKILTNTDLPSWGYHIKNGATTIWERWDGYKEGETHLDRMNSFNHFVFGSAAYWLFEGMMGVKPVLDNPAFKEVVVRPYLNEKIESAKTYYESVNGRFDCEYKFVNDVIKYTLDAPLSCKVNFEFVNQIISSTEKIEGDRKTYEFLLKK